MAQHSHRSPGCPPDVPAQTPDEADTAPSGYPPGRATKSEILRRAFVEFAENGYAATSLRAVARAAGISHATLLHHFPNKAALLQAVLELRDADQLIEPSTLDETLGLLLGIAIANERTPGLVRLYTVLAAEAADPAHPAREYFVQRGERLRRQIAEQLEAAIEDGTCPPCDDPALAAKGLVALWEGLQLQAPLDPDGPSVAAVLGRAFDRVAGHPIAPLPLSH